MSELIRPVEPITDEQKKLFAAKVEQLTGPLVSYVSSFSQTPGLKAEANHRVEEKNIWLLHIQLIDTTTDEFRVHFSYFEELPNRYCQNVTKRYSVEINSGESTIVETRELYRRMEDNPESMTVVRDENSLRILEAFMLKDDAESWATLKEQVQFEEDSGMNVFTQQDYLDVMEGLEQLGPSNKLS